jgi:N-acetylglucosamine kinase-like BadF-type ATPase
MSADPGRFRPREEVPTNIELELRDEAMDRVVDEIEDAVGQGNIPRERFSKKFLVRVGLRC